MTWTATGTYTAPVDTAELKKHMRIVDNDSDQDDVLDALIETANDHLTTYLQRSLITREITLTCDAFVSGSRRGPLSDFWYSDVPYGTPSGGLMQLPIVRAEAITSFTYIDSGGAQQSLTPSDYYLDQENGRLQPSDALVIWPQTAARINAVTIVYNAGYGAAIADIPSALRQGLYMLVAHWYEMREAYTTFSLGQVPHGFYEIVDSFQRTRR